MLKNLMKYLIKYENGMQQIRNLISESVYIDEYKKNADRKHELEVMIGDKTISNNKKKDLKDELYHVKKNLLPFNEPWFTEESPLGKAIQTGKLMLPKVQGGIRIVKLIKATD